MIDKLVIVSFMISLLTLVITLMAIFIEKDKSVEINQTIIGGGSGNITKTINIDGK